MKRTGKKKIKKTGVFGNAVDYSFYTMNFKEMCIGFAIGFASATLILYIYFGGIPLSLIGGAAAGCISLRYYKRILIEKRNKRLLDGFKQFLEELSTSYSAGSNTTRAFQDAYEGLRRSLGEENEMTKEVKLILLGIRNNYNIELLVRDFADRSGLEDIISFADIFEIAYRKGGDIRKIVADTRNVLCSKIDMERKIQGSLSSGKQELYIMMAMPLLITLFLNVDSSMSIASNTFVYLATKVGALVLFAAAFLIGRKIIKIKV